MPPWLQWTSFLLGLAGTTIGVMTGVRQILAARVKLRIRTYPLHVIERDGPGKTFVCVEIANPRGFPVTIKAVAFEPLDRPGSRMIDTTVRCLDGSPLPKRLEGKESIQVCFSEYDIIAEWIRVSRRVVVDTACGETRYGDFSEWRKMERALARPAVSETKPTVV